MICVLKNNPHNPVDVIKGKSDSTEKTVRLTKTTPELIKNRLFLITDTRITINENQKVKNHLLKKGSRLQNKTCLFYISVIGS